MITVVVWLLDVKALLLMKLQLDVLTAIQVVVLQIYIVIKLWMHVQV